MSEVTMKLIQPAEVVRNSDGSWAHPDFPQWDESTLLKTVNDWFEAQGLERSVVFFEYDAPAELIEVWEATGEADLKEWEPKSPNGVGWFMLSIHDTEDGPVCILARRETYARTAPPTAAGPCSGSANANAWPAGRSSR